MDNSNTCKLHIDNPGFFTTIQDMGRIGFQQYGMPVAGAMDSESYKLGQALVGNTILQGALECTILAPTITVQGHCVVAFTGADMEQTINGISVPRYIPFMCKPGDVISGGYTEKGVRMYISFSGTIDVPVVNSSVSTHTKAKIGGYEGRNLQKGDTLAVINIPKAHTELCNYDRRTQKIKNTALYNRDSLDNTGSIRVVLGPQNNAFTETGLHTFGSELYELSMACDRMGFRLVGAAIEHKESADIISDGAVFGSIQVPSDGQPIILMADRQTTGGYTKIGTVITPDLPRLSQIPIGHAIRFKIISVTDSHDLYIDYRESLEERLSIAKRQSEYIFSVL